MKIQVILSILIIVIFLVLCGSAPSEVTEVSDRVSFVQTQVPPTISSTEEASGDGLQRYVGVEYPPLPHDTAGGAAYLIPIEYNYALHFGSDTSGKILLLSKFTHYSPDGKLSYWRIMDAMIAPNWQVDETFIPNGCMLDGILDNEIFVMSSWDDEIYTSRFVTNDKVLQAWRANLEEEILEPISTDGIECYADNAIANN